MGEAARRLEANASDESNVRRLKAVTPQPADHRLTDSAAIGEFIARIPDEYLPCREGRRHHYPPVPLEQMRFKQVDGFDVFTNDCDECGVAYREEKWLIRERDGIVVRMQLIAATTKYRRLPENQPDYLLPPGSGYVGARDFRETRVALHFQGQKIRRVGRRGQGGTG